VPRLGLGARLHEKKVVDCWFLGGGDVDLKKKTR